MSGFSSTTGNDPQVVDVAGLTPTDNGVIIGNGSNFVVETGDTLHTSLQAAKPMFISYKSVEQTGIADATWTKVTYDTETTDLGGDYASSTFTAPITGNYQFFASFLYTAGPAATNTTGISFYLDGVKTVQQFYSMATVAIPNQNLEWTVRLTAGQTIEVYAYADIAAGTSTIGPGLVNTRFSGFLI